MEQSGGAIAARLPEPSPAAGGGGEDRLSALPNDVLVLILVRLNTAAAVRTCTLSRRWRRVWALLPKLRFNLVPDGPRIREILDAPEALSLGRISVTTKGAGPESAAAWLPVAARRLSGGLVYHNKTTPMKKGGGGGGKEAVGKGDVLLPCFDKATSIELDMGFLGLAMPSLGVFARLTKLSLKCVDFHGTCELGSAVSSPRCPFLKKLEICNSRGLQNLSIHSESLLEILLKNLHSLRELTIVAPTLQKLHVHNSLYVDDETEPVANISAPQLVYLTWKDVHVGNKGVVKSPEKRKTGKRDKDAFTSG